MVEYIVSGLIVLATVISAVLYVVSTATATSQYKPRRGPKCLYIKDKSSNSECDRIYTVSHRKTGVD